MGRVSLHLPPLPTVGELLKIYKIQASKRLSQNFLLDQNLCKKLVNKSGPLRDAYVLEIGPGPGSLTRTILAARPKKVVLVEKDRRFMPILTQLKNAVEDVDSYHGVVDRVEIKRADILYTPLHDIFPPEARRPWDADAPPINVIGNLPFAISTPLLIQWLDHMSKRTGIFEYGRVGFTLTFQKEVADRMMAGITNSERCRLSVMCQLYAKMDMCFAIPGRCFLPPPKVDVGVVTIRPKIENEVPELDFKMVEKVVRNVFQFRQKHIKNCLERLFPPLIAVLLTKRMLDQSGVTYDNRPHFLSNEEIRRLALAYSEICNEIPEIYDYEHQQPLHMRGPIEESVMKTWNEMHPGFRVLYEIEKTEESFEQNAIARVL